MMPSVLYVTCLELYSVGAGSEAAWDNTVILQMREAQYETHKVKHGNHISCAFEISG